MKLYLNNIVNFTNSFVLVTITISMGMLIFGITYPQQPYSDFLIHWNQALDHSMYIKGGALVYIYSFFAALNLDASSSALTINILSWLIFSASCFPGEIKYLSINIARAIKCLFLLVLLTYGYWWIAVASTVEVMTVHVALLCAGIRLCFSTKSKFILVIGVILVGIALSMRMQMIVMLMFASIFYLSFYLFFIKNNIFNFFKKNKNYILVILLSVGLGSFIEVYLRSQSKNQLEIAVMQRSQLYIGLIDSDKKLSSCGAWKQEAVDNARNEINNSIFKIGFNFIQDKSISDFASIFICKTARSMLSKIYVWWIPESSVIYNGIEFSTIRHYFINIEFFSNIIGKISLALIIFLLFIKVFRGKCHYIIALGSILFGYIFLYGLLEFNPRYQYQMVASLLFIIAISLFLISKDVNTANDVKN